MHFFGLLHDDGAVLCYITCYFKHWFTL